MKITLLFASSKECRNLLSNIHFMHKWVLIFEKFACGAILKIAGPYVFGTGRAGRAPKGAAPAAN